MCVSIDPRRTAAPLYRGRSALRGLPRPSTVARPRVGARPAPGQPRRWPAAAICAGVSRTVNVQRRRETGTAASLQLAPPTIKWRRATAEPRTSNRRTVRAGSRDADDRSGFHLVFTVTTGNQNERRRCGRAKTSSMTPPRNDATTPTKRHTFSHVRAR